METPTRDGTMHLTEKINRRMAKYDNRFLSLVGRDVSYEYIAKLVTEIIKPYGAYAALIDETTVAKAFEMSGWYDHDQPAARRIQLSIHKPQDRTTIVPTIKAVKRLRHRVAQCLQHELIHKSQYSHRDAHYISHDIIKRVGFHTPKRVSKKQLETIEYLTDRDEIDSYAHDIAYEIKLYYPHIASRSILRTIMQRRYLDSMKFYTKGFKGMEWNKVRKKLLGRIYKWLPNVTPVPELATP